MYPFLTLYRKIRNFNDLICSRYAMRAYKKTLEELRHGGGRHIVVRPSFWPHGLRCIASRRPWHNCRPGRRRYRLKRKASRLSAFDVPWNAVGLPLVADVVEGVRDGRRFLWNNTRYVPSHH
jgi:hypothetical protein